MTRHATRRAVLVGVPATAAMMGVAPHKPYGALLVTVTTLKPPGKVIRRRRERRRHEDVVVFLRGVDETLPETTNRVTEIRQIDEQFVPRVSVVLVGTKLSFPNDDRFQHNVFSPESSANFDLGAYKSDTTKTYVPDAPGEIKVFCDIHPHMEAYVLVLETTYWGISADDGKIWIGDIPPGTYEWEAWSPHAETASGTIEIEPKTNALDLELVVHPSPRHLNKDGKPYPPY